MTMKYVCSFRAIWSISGWHCARQVRDVHEVVKMVIKAKV